MKKTSTKIGRNVLAELDHFDDNFQILVTDVAVRSEQVGRLVEPFVCWIRVMESIDGRAETERIYLVCRGDTPINYSPKDQIAMFANRDSKAGRIASIDPGNEITIDLPYNRGRKTIRVVEKDVFLPSKKKGNLWDALNNQFSFHLDDEFVVSLREKLEGDATPAPIRDISTQSESPDVRVEQSPTILEELRELEDSHQRAQLEKRQNRLNRMREVVNSIALKDQPVLDATQDNFCRMRLKSQLILSGSPGTGKTTSLIKRVAMKTGASHLEESDGVTLSDDDRRNWLFFTPNDLLKIYLKEAMSKEGLPATDQFVTTWERERGILGRDVLGFLKRGDKGIFKKTEQRLLVDSSSSGIMRTCFEFIAFFENEFSSLLQSALDNLQGLNFYPQDLTKETHAIVGQYNTFAASTGDLRNRLGGGLDLLGAVANLSRLATSYSQIRNSTDRLINRVVDNWIEENRELFNDLVDLIQGSANSTPPLSDDPIDSIDDGKEETELDRQPVDPKLMTRNRIRQVVAQGSEARVLGKKIRGNDAQFIWDYLGLTDEISGELLVAGTLRLALRPAIFRINSYNRLLAEIPRAYRRFRASDFAKLDGSNFGRDAGDAIDGQRISVEEIDILVFSMLRLASEIREFGGKSVELELQRELLGKISDQFRTHIVVDEATDFSAIQLASIFHLTNPRYRAATFSGDLMQRVTTEGLGDWKELEDLVPTIQRIELVASYRQTPTLLRIAKKLYTEIIGEEPPFDSRHNGGAAFPAPLKYAGVLDDALAEWLASRIYEIYQINGGSLPSIAIFVPAEDDIDRAHGLLKEALSDFSIEVEACKLGKILGAGSNIRIFSIEFIKGLEFEGVFYIDIDRSHNRHTDLVDKYLYVGLTRATTFLGITYSERLPSKFAFLEEDFVAGDWQEFA